MLSEGIRHERNGDRPSLPHLLALDGLRGVAVLRVLALHTIADTQSSNIVFHTIGLAALAGWRGVTLFFVLSGFLITGILLDNIDTPHWQRNFYARRVLRIFPLYYGALTLAVGFSWWTHVPANPFSGTWLYAFFLRDFCANAPGDDVRPLWLGHLWSVAVEEQFYLFWPFVIAQVRSPRALKKVCLCIFLGSLMFRLVIWPGAYTTTVNYLLPSRAGELALGGFLAICYRDCSWQKVTHAAPWVGIFSAVGLAATSLHNSAADLANRSCSVLSIAFATLLYGAVLALALRPGVVQRAMTVGWLRWTGRISYGIYVFHGLLLGDLFGGAIRRITAPLGHKEAVAVQILSIWVGSFFVAWASYRFFELPILRLRRYFAREGTGSSRAEGAGV